ncbi:hypothetical protein ACIBG8_23450 [Nonomuraea sp. NPDC050556]|uniref:hypothetical protein n=1 Tax=Nonomuraea sp. NPDC050556 TaxID=3364369 RepID=UPI0037956369
MPHGTRPGTEPLTVTATDRNGGTASVNGVVVVDPDHQPVISGVKLPTWVKQGQKVVVEARATAFKGVESVRVLGGGTQLGIPMRRVAGDARNGLYRGEFVARQTMKAVIEARDVDGRVATTDPRRLEVQLATKLTFDASPEPVRKGGKLHARGTLRAGYVDLAGRQVKIQFARSGSSTYRTMATVTMTALGGFDRVLKAKDDGRWRAVYTGTSAYASAVSAGDYVNVR